MDTKTIGILVAVALVASTAGFYGGTTYAGRTQANQQFTQRPGGPTRGGNRGGGASFTTGTIIAKDANSITIELGGPNATSTNAGATGSRIVLLSGSTQVGKFVTGAATDLTIGQTVMVNGSTNTDGSVTAQMIQIRPTGAGFGPRGQ